MLSALLLAVSVAAIVTLVLNVRNGTTPIDTARFQIIAYGLIAVYASVSIVVRTRQGKP